MSEKIDYQQHENYQADQEKKDIQANRPVYIIYRDNELYSKIVPGLVENLRSVGKKVDVEVFDRNTSQDEISVVQPRLFDQLPEGAEIRKLQQQLSDIKSQHPEWRPNMETEEEWAQEAKALSEKIKEVKNSEYSKKRDDLISQTYIISDATCNSFLNIRGDYSDYLNLDDAVSEIYSKLYFNKELPKSQASNREFNQSENEERLDNLLQLVSELKERYPDIEKVALISYAFDAHDGYSTSQAKEKLIQLFPADKIEEYRTVDDFENDGHTLVITDRHHLANGRDLEKAGSHRIILPIASALEDLAKNGRIELNKEEVEKQLFDYIRSEFYPDKQVQQEKILIYLQQNQFEKLKKFIERHGLPQEVISNEEIQTSALKAVLSQLKLRKTEKASVIVDKFQLTEKQLSSPDFQSQIINIIDTNLEGYPGIALDMMKKYLGSESVTNQETIELGKKLLKKIYASGSDYDLPKVIEIKKLFSFPESIEEDVDIQASKKSAMLNNIMHGDFEKADKWRELTNYRGELEEADFLPAIGSMFEFVRESEIENKLKQIEELESKFNLNHQNVIGVIREKIDSESWFWKIESNREIANKIKEKLGITKG